MRYLSVDELLLIHFELIRCFGGTKSLRDFGLLHSAAERPKASFAGQDLYLSVFDKAAALLHSLIFNHPFFDGNKRTAFTATARFLYLNGHIINATQGDLVDYLLSTFKSRPTIDQIALWLKQHTKTAKP